MLVNIQKEYKTLKEKVETLRKARALSTSSSDSESLECIESDPDYEDESLCKFIK